MLATHETLLKFGKQTVSDLCFFGLLGFGADNSTTTGSHAKAAARGIELPVFARAAGLAATPSINLSHQLPLPALPEHPVAAWLRQQREKKNNLLTVSGLLFFARPGLDWNSFSNCPLFTVRACSPGAFPPCPGPALPFPNAPPA